jgi:MSHA biogenesis protein MshN
LNATKSWVSGPTHIDKRSQPLTPEQVAENEYRDAAQLLGQNRFSEAQEGFRRVLQKYPEHSGARQGLFGLLFQGSHPPVRTPTISHC